MKYSFEIKKSHFSDLFLFLFFTALFYIYLIDANSLLAKALLVVFGAVFVLSVQRRIPNKIKINNFIFIFGLLFWLLCVILVFISGSRFDIPYFIVLEFVSVSLGYTLVKRREYHCLVFKSYWVFLFVVSLSCFLDFLGAYKYEGAFFGGASVNYSTSLLLGLALLTIALKYSAEGSCRYLYLLPVILVSIYLNSRFSAIVSFLAFLLVFLVAIYRDHRWVGIVYFCFGWVFFLGLILFYDFSDGADYVLSDPRIIIWRDYFSNVDFLDYMYGVDFYTCCTVIGDTFRNNPHNSIIRSFSIFGIGAVFYMLMIFVVVMVFIVHVRARFIAAIFMLWFLRCLSDSIAIPYYFDFIFFALFFLVFDMAANEASVSSKRK